MHEPHMFSSILQPSQPETLHVSKTSCLKNVAPLTPNPSPFIPQWGSNLECMNPTCFQASFNPHNLKPFMPQKPHACKMQPPFHFKPLKPQNQSYLKLLRGPPFNHPAFHHRPLSQEVLQGLRVHHTRPQEGKATFPQKPHLVASTSFFSRPQNPFPHTKAPSI